MTLYELIMDARIALDDLVEPYLWSDRELTRYIDLAQREACERANLIIDFTTPSVCHIPIEANKPYYHIHPYILKIYRAKLDSQATVLEKISIRDLDANIYSWESMTGAPNSYFMQSDSVIRLFPTPDKNDMLRLHVSRYPLFPISDVNPIPEIPEIYHSKLIDWVCYKAYLKQDADTFDLAKAKTHEMLFTSSFGVRPTVNTSFIRKIYPQSATIKARPFGG